MPMLLHELHPALVHLPLTLIPSAVAVDALALLAQDENLERVGRSLWIAGATSAVVAGVTGLAAADEVRLSDATTADMVFVHGTGNAIVTLATGAIAAYRLARAPTALQVIAGVVGVGTALYTAALGGKMVYERGVGIQLAVPGAAPPARAVPVLSAQAPFRLLKDAIGGLRWIARRASFALKGMQPLARGAMGRRTAQKPGGFLGAKQSEFVH